MFQTRYIKYGTLSGLILLCTIILGTTEDSQRLVFAQITPAPAPEDSGSTHQILMAVIAMMILLVRHLVPMTITMIVTELPMIQKIYHHRVKILIYLIQMTAVMVGRALPKSQIMI